MDRVDRCHECDGDVVWMEFKKSQCCVWCGLHYTLEGKPNEQETPDYEQLKVEGVAKAQARK